MTKRLTTEAFNEALIILAQRDADLGKIIKEFDNPPMLRRSGGFRTLVLLILEQQVSVSSARATFDRLIMIAGKLTPRRAIELSDEEFRGSGISRQKTRYIRHLSHCLLDKTLRIQRLPYLDDDSVREQLTQVKGIGSWTAEVYLLMCLQRPDVWPVGDIALQAAAHEIKGLQMRPGPQELMNIGDRWRPWRGVAARILWHHYLNSPRLSKPRTKRYRDL
ncbi:MAG: putative bifunctional transcriptional activator/DNA repair enzyme AlkA [Alphaproteobacteria bacterium MarineAlpha11_Bin1]|nr:MAG: putative bifunctional transcriptional activator/DNA repair enzyme AlkA [Alphaproteobacteria bacterium MarineAlpha11_Bin1]|tara:strand:+ start:14261 stop:14920 length:660 start_codon:yes stop_codon:yes gene_type:complete